MSWASRRRFQYITGVIIFFALLVGIPAVYWYTSIPATCSDGIQNQGETSPDRGGPCLLLDERYLQPSAVLWSRSFKVRDGTYTAAAIINNTNKDAGVVSVHYHFSLYDSSNILVAERTGATYIMPGTVTPVIEARIDTGNRVVAHTYFEFTEQPQWERMKNQVGVLSITNKELTNITSTPQLDASVQNTGVADVVGPLFVAVIYDGAGNAFAASQTNLDRLGDSQSAHITFTWPSAFDVQPARVDILPLLPPVPDASAAR